MSHFFMNEPSCICAVVSTVDTPWFQYNGHKGSVHEDHREAVQQRMTIAGAWTKKQALKKVSML